MADEIGTTDPPLFAFKRGRNIWDCVVSSYLRDKTTPDTRALLILPPLQGHFKCGFCKACDLTVEQKDFTRNGKQFVLHCHTNCNTKDVIYIDVRDRKYMLARPNKRLKQEYYNIVLIFIVMYKVPQW